MKINLVYHHKDEEKLIGYDIVPEEGEDFENVAAVRDMIFFGIGDTAIKYDGREMKTKDRSYDPKNIKKIRFRKRKFKTYG